MHFTVKTVLVDP